MSTAGQRARIQLISFVAVLFALLAVFAAMVLGMEKRTKISLQVGGHWCNCGGWPTDKHEKTILLQVTDCGVFWNRELSTQKELPDRLARHIAICKIPSVTLACDDSAKYGTAIEVLDEVRKAGIKNVIVETLHRPTGK